MASDGVYCVVVSSTITGAPELFLVKPEELDVDAHCTAFTLASLENHGFPCCDCGVVVNRTIFFAR